MSLSSVSSISEGISVSETETARNRWYLLLSTSNIGFQAAGMHNFQKWTTEMISISLIAGASRNSVQTERGIYWQPGQVLRPVLEQEQEWMETMDPCQRSWFTSCHREGKPNFCFLWGHRVHLWRMSSSECVRPIENRNRTENQQSEIPELDYENSQILL
jgi:hypothetical protein